MHTDPIADMLTRIRNAQAVHQMTVSIPLSKMNSALLTLLKHNNYISDFATDEQGNIHVTLLYDKAGKPKIRHIKRISKPGHRTYSGKDTLPVVLNDYGISIVSTSRGLMTNKQARVQRIGGEILCEVY